MAQVTMEFQVRSLAQHNGLKDPVLCSCGSGQSLGICCRCVHFLFKKKLLDKGIIDLFCLSTFFFFFFFFFFAFSLAAPKAYGGSQARGQIRAVAAGLCHSHSNAGSEPHPRPTPQLTAMPDPQPTEHGQGSNLQRHGSQ